MGSVGPCPIVPIAKPSSVGQSHWTIHLADTQFEVLGRRTFIDSSLVVLLFPPASRNVASVATLPPYVQALFRCAIDQIHSSAPWHQSLALPGGGPQIVCMDAGDTADTPCLVEIGFLEMILNNAGIPLRGFTTGNHSRSNIFGVFNLLSTTFDGLRRYLKRPQFLDDELCQACTGSEGDAVLTPSESFRTMHRMLHNPHVGKPDLVRINRHVTQANSRWYLLEGSRAKHPIDRAHCRDVFETFWFSDITPGGREYWECVVNYDVADLPKPQRKNRVDPFYIQASLETRFELKDGTTVPVYSINLDTQDQDHLLATVPGISEFQIRLAEVFMAERLRENPKARFKLHMHFPVQREGRVPTLKMMETVLHPLIPFRRRRALRRLLSREEVILVTSGHTHERYVHDLNEALGLGRRTPLMEVTFPSLVDFHPKLNPDGTFQDARALGLERTWVEYDYQKRPFLRIAIEYRGIHTSDLSSLTPRVNEALEAYQKHHGYHRAHRLMKILHQKYAMGWVRRHARRFSEIFTIGLNPWSEGFAAYWRDRSFLQYLVDNLTLVSIIQMFIEARYLMPLLEALLPFVDVEWRTPEGKSVRAEIQEIWQSLRDRYPVAQPAFRSGFLSGAPVEKLRQFNDFFLRAGVDRLSKLFLSFPKGSQAEAFVVLAGLQASEDEYRYHRRRPTSVPNAVPVFNVPL